MADDMTAEGKRIVAVDDEPDLLELLALHLGRAGFSFHGFESVGDFEDFIAGTVPDLIILDLMLPGSDGFEICKNLKKSESVGRVPIIMLTAKGGEMDKVLGLELGADDYITKPFSPAELVARIKAVLRRPEPPDESPRIGIGKLVIDKARHEVRHDGRKIVLTSTEFRILTLLASKKGWVFSREQILDYLWGHEKAVVDRTIDVHIRNLREKLGPAAALIKNIRGAGYKLEE
ncbi:MAG TPA: response regulator transcription factor [Candidatus Aminicenantes bacterium]|nr:response regulator transcription factor [Candidatus Aminicenantes bacterium]